MMADFVHQYVVNEMLERLALGRPFVEDGAAIEENAVGQGARLVDAFLGQRQAVIEAGQVERVVDAHHFEGLVVGKFLDRQDDVAEVRRERLGQPFERRAGDRLDVRRAGRRSEPSRPWPPGIAEPRGHATCRARTVPLNGAFFQSMRSGGRVVEGARLESEYTAKPYRGFESLPLRHLTFQPCPIKARKLGWFQVCSVHSFQFCPLSAGQSQLKKG